MTTIIENGGNSGGEGGKILGFLGVPKELRQRSGAIAVDHKVHNFSIEIKRVTCKMTKRQKKIQKKII